MRKYFAVLVLIAAVAPARAAPDAACGADLQRAWELVDAVAKRDRGGPYGPSQICAVLRQNLADMKQSTEIMRRCMTGHALRENVGQMDASMEDVGAVIAARCR